LEFLMGFFDADLATITPRSFPRKGAAGKLLSAKSPADRKRCASLTVK
jgi:hypothetical protein